MRTANIALIGFRATGKSTVGRILASRLGLKFVDLDEEITRNLGLEIREWVNRNGWDSFRNQETAALRRASAENGLVLAAGGGIVIRQENRQLLKKHFFNVWLEASAETIHLRILADPATPAQRPPLTALTPEEEIRALLSERTDLYSEVANLVLDTDSLPSAHHAAEAVLTAPALRGLIPATPTSLQQHIEENKSMSNHWWVKEIGCAVTVCDTKGIIIYMNDKSIEWFHKRGGAGLLGTNVLDCHPEPARSQLAEMLENQTPHVFSTEKDGQKKLLFETPLYENGVYKGFIEIGMEIPADAPHYIR